MAKPDRHKGLAEEIMSIVAKGLACHEKFDMETDLFEAGILDSLSSLKLTFLIEERYNIKIGLADVVNGGLKDIRSIACLIKEKSGNSGGKKLGYTD